MTDEQSLRFLVRSSIIGALSGLIYGLLLPVIGGGTGNISIRSGFYGIFFGILIGAVNGYILQSVTSRFFPIPTKKNLYRVVLGLVTVVTVTLLSIFSLYVLIFAYSRAPMNSEYMMLMLRLLWFPVLSSVLTSQYLGWWYIKDTFKATPS